MIKSSTQLKDLIRNLSKKKSADAQILMRNYMVFTPKDNRKWLSFFVLWK